MRALLVFVLFVLVGFTGFMTYHLGALKSVKVTKGEYPAYYVIYKDHMGPYHKTVTAIEEVEKWAQQNKIDCRLSFGKYLDNPDSIEEARLRSQGGCLIHNKDGLGIAEITKMLPTLPVEYKIEAHPKQEFVMAEFDGSPGIGPMKVYPKVKEFFEENQLRAEGPVIEVYEILDRNAKREMKTQYLFAIAK